jgi:hypothetical protein
MTPDPERGVWKTMVCHIPLTPTCSKGPLRMGNKFTLFFVKDPDFTDNQCDQIGQYFATWATLTYFLLNQFSPNQAVSTQNLLKGFQGFKSGSMKMFCALKLIFWHVSATFSEHWARFYSIIWSHF